MKHISYVKHIYLDEVSDKEFHFNVILLRANYRVCRDGINYVIYK